MEKAKNDIKLMTDITVNRINKDYFINQGELWYSIVLITRDPLWWQVEILFAGKMKMSQNKSEKSIEM